MRINRNSRRNAMRTNASRRNLNCNTMGTYDIEALAENYGTESAHLIVRAARALGYSNDECISHEWEIFYDCYTPDDFGHAYIEWANELIDLPDSCDWVRDYLDYDAYGRALLSGMYYWQSDNCYVVDITRSM